ncbi:MAG: MFS transporter [Ruminococcaceae bacterium]|nr:MFS transporter [Oscillospiraceae bacterium]
MKNTAEENAMNEYIINSKPFRVSRVLYIIEAALEYFISILVQGSFLATLTTSLEISDSVTGVISSFISLGCIFQLLSVFLKRPRLKSIVVPLSVLNQLLFMCLYIIPLSGLEKQFKAALFIIVLFVAYLILNSVHPLKISWLMSLVDNNKRGVFTSRKERVSLISGMIVTYSAGAVIDYYKAQGNVEKAFLVCGVAVFVITVLHTLTMVFSVESIDKQTLDTGKKNPIGEMIYTLKDKNVLKVAGLYALWNIADYSAIPFFGTYQIKELGFSMKFVSFIAIIYAIIRATVCTFWGKYADKKTFAHMLRACFCMATLSFLVCVFMVPSNGTVLYIVFYSIYAISCGGVSNALINLVFDIAKTETRSSALAVTNAVAGTVGFLTTLAVSPLVEYIQNNGNRFLGMNIYAQQVVSMISFIFGVISIVYLTFVVIPIKKEKTIADPVK